MLETNIWFWAIFNVCVIGLLILDLTVFHRKAHTVSLKEALIWSVIWIALSLAFNLGIYLIGGSEPALQFLTGYLIEKSLSVDNIFVFVLIFSYFRVAPVYQHRVLFWGILGALIMRGALILVGSVLLEQFSWIIYIFGAFLVFTGIRMAFRSEGEVDPNKNPILRLARRFFPVADDYQGERFVIRRDGRRFITPLLLVLLVVETTDLVFAVDSIPAIFAVTSDPFIVYTSNVCAILGLRALYFVFASIIDKFYYLRFALAIILSFVGIKMILSHIFPIPTLMSLLVIVVILAIAIVASVIRNRRLAKKPLRIEA
jgi:tellurite resistance protein TerC